jgi:hypothetical protein
MQIHTCSDQTKPQQKIFFWADVLINADLLQRPRRIAWMDEEGGEI